MMNSFNKLGTDSLVSQNKKGIYKKSPPLRDLIACQNMHSCVSKESKNLRRRI